MGSDVAERNRRIVERFIEGILDGRLDVVDQLCAPGLINHAAAPQARDGIDGMRHVIGFSRAAMPDQRWTERVVIADDEYVVVRAVGRAPGQRSLSGGCPRPKV